MTFLYPRLYLKCFPPRILMNAERPLLVTESVTIVLPGYFLIKSGKVSQGAQTYEYSKIQNRLAAQSRACLSKISA